MYSLLFSTTLVTIYEVMSFNRTICMKKLTKSQIVLPMQLCINSFCSTFTHATEFWIFSHNFNFVLTIAQILFYSFLLTVFRLGKLIRWGLCASQPYTDNTQNVTSMRIKDPRLFNSMFTCIEQPDLPVFCLHKFILE